MTDIAIDKLNKLDIDKITKDIDDCVEAFKTEGTFIHNELPLIFIELDKLKQQKESLEKLSQSLQRLLNVIENLKIEYITTTKEKLYGYIQDFLKRHDDSGYALLDIMGLEVLDIVSGYMNLHERVAESYIKAYQEQLLSEGNNMVKFISYDQRTGGRCFGTLTLEIDGNRVSFKDCLKSGGYLDFDDKCDMIKKGPWSIDGYSIPDEYKKYIPEIEKVVNENVEWGCCGMCI